MVQINITTQGELVARLDQVPARLRAAVKEKLQGAIEAAYTKAVLQFSAGKYESTNEVERGVEEQGSLAIGYIEPVTVKAKVQEYGGTNWYEIVPNKSRFLVFLGSKDGAKVFTKHVWHPPVPAKHYIEQALIAERPELEREFALILPEIMR